MTKTMRMIWFFFVSIFKLNKQKEKYNKIKTNCWSVESEWAIGGI